MHAHSIPVATYMAGHLAVLSPSPDLTGFLFGLRPESANLKSFRSFRRDHHLFGNCGRG